MKRYLTLAVVSFVTLVYSLPAKELLEEPSAANPFSQAIVVANNQFALDLYARLGDDIKAGNRVAICFSHLTVC